MLPIHYLCNPKIHLLWTITLFWHFQNSIIPASMPLHDNGTPDGPMLWHSQQLNTTTNPPFNCSSNLNTSLLLQPQPHPSIVLAISTLFCLYNPTMWVHWHSQSPITSTILNFDYFCNHNSPLLSHIWWLVALQHVTLIASTDLPINLFGDSSIFCF